MAGHAVTISLSEKAAELAHQQAARLGFSDVGHYIETLIAEEAQQDFGAPEHLSPRTREQLEALIQEGLSSPARTMTHDDWEVMRRDLKAKYGKGA